mmetsp:Transcript_17174/g.44430  ORF Transcript_17174/g.44430 Transcript_17174/m.44430 type:complete len:279 (+) Transcript_17174:1516-2352(+)
MYRWADVPWRKGSAWRARYHWPIAPRDGASMNHALAVAPAQSAREGGASPPTDVQWPDGASVGSTVRVGGPADQSRGAPRQARGDSPSARTARHTGAASTSGAKRKRSHQPSAPMPTALLSPAAHREDNEQLRARLAEACRRQRVLSCCLNKEADYFADGSTEYDAVHERQLKSELVLLAMDITQMRAQLEAEAPRRAARAGGPDHAHEADRPPPPPHPYQQTQSSPEERCETGAAAAKSAGTQRAASSVHAAGEARPADAAAPMATLPRERDARSPC